MQDHRITGKGWDGDLGAPSRFISFGVTKRGPLRASSREREGSNVQASGECGIGDSPPPNPTHVPRASKYLCGRIWWDGLTDLVSNLLASLYLDRLFAGYREDNFSASTLTCPFKMALGRMRWEANEDFWRLSYSMAKQLSQPTPKFTKPLGNLGALVMVFEVGPAVAVCAYPYKATERGPRHQRMAKDRGPQGGLEATLGEEGQTGCSKEYGRGTLHFILKPHGSIK